MHLQSSLDSVILRQWGTGVGRDQDCPEADQMAGKEAGWKRKKKKTDCMRKDIWIWIDFQSISKR